MQLQDLMNRSAHRRKLAVCEICKQTMAGPLRKSESETVFARRPLQMALCFLPPSLPSGPRLPRESHGRIECSLLSFCLIMRRLHILCVIRSLCEPVRSCLFFLEVPAAIFFLHDYTAFVVSALTDGTSPRLNDAVVSSHVTKIIYSSALPWVAL